MGGTGRYAGATGLLVGGGVIRFDPDFTPHPTITYALLLGLIGAPDANVS